ncbi:curli production assembly/transport protein CsgG [Candidimonas nitroreducens]|uniref:Curli production assembly/transport protein CsgG n=2 Tax=Candidimonas nitroreducens TaxID=683354 RepID=A0A225MYQ4_9BURK|nr:curli production assembly/transport protein CsgG [Candidimonas nitroreducens]
MPTPPACLRPARLCVVGLAALALSACALQQPANVSNQAQLAPATPSTVDLMRLPPPRKKIVAAVYGFRDETGQYKPSPDSSFSTAVTQGAASMLMKALKDSGWYIPVEREGLQSLLTERRVLRAVDEHPENGAQRGQVPNLLPATIILEGGIIAYDSNARTGGLGAQFLGIGLSTKYSVDQVTVNLRAVDVSTGAILNSVSTTKTIYSYELHPSYFRFVNYYDLLEIEGGYTHNEPAQIAVKEAIDAAVMHLTVQGLKDRQWSLKNPSDWNNPLIQRYLQAEKEYTVTVTPRQSAQAGTASTATNSQTSVQ